VAYTVSTPLVPPGILVRNPIRVPFEPHRISSRLGASGQERRRANLPGHAPGPWVQHGVVADRHGRGHQVRFDSERGILLRSDLDRVMGSTVDEQPRCRPVHAEIDRQANSPCHASCPGRRPWSPRAGGDTQCWLASGAPPAIAAGERDGRGGPARRRPRAAARRGSPVRGGSRAREGGCARPRSRRPPRRL
jgi:hypothetical protein